MSENIIKLRKIKKSDLPYFVKWWEDEELIKTTSGINEKDENILRGYFFCMLESKKDSHYVIQYNSKVVGNISITHKNRSTFEVHIVVGEKEYWGKGIGTVSIKKILKIAFLSLDYTTAYIEVRPENQRAIRLYAFCGFRKIGLKKYPKNKYQPVVLKMKLDKKDFIKIN